MSKILSGKVKKVSPSEVSADRYNFLSLGEAEPDLGVPAASGYLLSSDASGNRSWIESVVSIAGVVGEVSAQDLLDAIKTVDGTGSGLDADLLDGQSLGDLDNRYVNVDGDTMTGYLVINGVAPDTVTSLVTTGYVGVGNSSPSYELDVTGEINASVSVRAPIFYDSGDDSFYLDPANNATSLNVAGDIITAGDVSITGGITTVDSVQLNTSASVTVSTGEIAWNSDDETLDLGLTNGTVLQLGQEVHYHVQNQSGSTIADGRLVVAAGSIGNSGKILIEEWDPATYPPITIMGLTTETMANGESGYVTHFGKVRGIQTNGANYGETWLDGDIIYAGPSGGLTKVAPQAPNTKTIVALVITAHASNGTLFVRPTLSSSLANDDLVQLSSLSDNDLLYYNASNGRFENTSSLNTLTVDGINIDGTTISPSGVTAITVTGLETPVNATDAVNKAYVDGLVEGVSVRPAVKAATTANLSGTYDNGTDGIGATLNLGPAATLDIDGVTSWFEFDGVLVKDQTNAPENGRYYISQVGNASTDWILTRCGYCDEPAEIAAMYIFVQSGTVNAATGWVAVMSDSNSSGTLQVGIDDITFIQFSGAGTYTAGAGLELNGTVFSHADTSAAANLTASSRTYVTGLTFDTFGHVTGYTTGTETVVNTDTKYAISTEPGDNVYSKKIRLEGTDASSDDIVIAVGAVDTVYGLTISEAGDTITLAHANTSSVSNLSSDNANGNVIQDIALTFDTYGHVTGATVGTVNLDTRYDNYGSWTAQDGDTTSYTVTSGDILQFAEGNDINVNFTADDVLTFSHVDIARTDTNDTLSPGYGGSFTVVDSVTTSDRGHVTAVNLKTVTLPSADDTNTTYAISVEAGGDAYSEKIRLTGSDSTTDDVTIAVGAVDTVYGLTIGRTNDVITLAHANTSSVSNLSSDNSNGTVIQDIALTFDTYGHVTGATAATVDLDSRYVNVTGDTMTGDLKIEKNQAKLILSSTEGNPTDQSIQIRNEPIDANLPGSEGIGIIFETTSTNGSPDTTPAVITTGEFYAQSNQKVFHDNYHPNADTLTTARTISLTGDVTGSVSFNGSANVSITATVADDSHDHIISNVDGLQDALDLKAPLASPALTGTPTAPTAAATTNDTQIATTAFVQTAVANLVDAAPGTLDTLNELAAALGDDPNFATTVTNAIAAKVSKSGDTMTGDLTIESATPQIKLSDSDATGNPYSRLYVNGGLFSIDSDFGNTGASSYIRFTVDSDEKVRITDTGNVGIGTSSPAAKLNVIGDSIIGPANPYNNDLKGSQLYVTGPNIGSSSANLSIGTSGTSSGNFASPYYLNLSFRGYLGDEKSRISAWDVTGNQSNNGVLQFWTKGSSGIEERMRITSDGNVGIGTTTPVSKLQIGSVGSTGYAVSAGLAFGDGTRAGALNTDANGVTLYSTTNLIFSPSTVEKMRITSDGNVGIGTSSPARTLEVFATSSSMVAQFKSGLGDNSFICFANNSSTADQVRIGSTQGNLILSTNYTERVRIDSSGNVGIGTSAPVSKLDISGLVPVSTALAVGGVKISDPTSKTYPTTAGFQITLGTESQLEFGTSQTYDTSTGFNNIYGDRRIYTKSSGLTSDIERLYFNGFYQSFTWSDLNTCKQYIGFNDIFVYRGIDANGRTSSSFNSNTILIQPPDGGTQTVLNVVATKETTYRPDGSSTINVTNSRNVTPLLRISNINTGTKTVNITDHTFLGTNTTWGVSGTTGTVNATITNLYGLRLTPPLSSTGLTITNNWGISQEWAAAKNYFAGNVGIGTNTPGTKLDVLGSVGDVAIFRQANVVLKVGTTNLGNGEVYYDAYPTSDPNQGSAHIWRQGGTETARIDLNGNLGIGTSSPLQKLHIYNGSLQIESSSASGNAWTYYKNGDRTWLVGVQGSSADSLSFYDLNADIQRMCITSAGNVGIGTSAPAGKLHATGDVIQQTSIESNQSFYLQIRKSRGSVDAPTAVVSNNDIVGGIQFIGYTGTQWLTGSGLRAEVDGTVTTSSAPMNLKFFTGGSMATGTERMRITAAGNVGIGTSSPAHKLDVNGTTKSSVFRVADTVQIDDSTATTTSTTQTAIASWSATTFGGAKVIVEAKTGVNRHITELLITHDGTTAVATEYGIVHTAGQLATYDVDISGGNVRLLATAASATSTAYKVMQTMLFA